jgi:hypothetical protein
MSIREVYSILGLPQRDVGYGLPILEWDFETGEILLVNLHKSVENNDWYVAGCGFREYVETEVA